MHPLVKAGIGTFTIGTVATTGYLGSTYLKENNKSLNIQKGIAISKLINDKYDYIPLETVGEVDNAIWSTIWNNYKRDNSGKAKGQDSLQLPNWKSENPDDLTSELKEKCEKLWKSTTSGVEDELYKKTTKYCARGVTFEEQAKKDTLTILDTENTNKDSKIWDSRNTKKASYSNDFTNLGITDTADANKIKEGCKTAKSKNKQVTNYETVYASYRKLCTKQEGD